MFTWMAHVGIYVFNPWLKDSMDVSLSELQELVMDRESDTTEWLNWTELNWKPSGFCDEGGAAASEKSDLLRNVSGNLFCLVT